jgi:hypothetical protein
MSLVINEFQGDRAMSGCIGESWDARIRERARQYSEHTGERDELRNWLRAKEDLWQETVAEQRPLALKLNEMRESLDEGTDEGLRAAAAAGCKVMHILANDTKITCELFQRAGKQLYDKARTDVSEYLDDLDLLEDFLAVERKVLVRTGLSPEQAAELCGLLKGRQQTMKNEVLQIDVITLLNKAVEKACLPYATAFYTPTNAEGAPKQPHAIFRRSMRVLWRIGAGGQIVGANVAAVVAIGDVTAEVSKAVGSAVIGSGITAFIG